MMKKIKLKDLLKKSIKEQTTPYYGDNDNIVDPPKSSDVPYKYNCITITKPGHISGFEVGDKTCVESPTGEFSTMDECRSACGPGPTSPHTPFSCWDLQDWIDNNSGPTGSNELFQGPNSVTTEQWCEVLCPLPEIQNEFNVMCGCCETIDCYKCNIDGTSTTEETFYSYGISSEFGFASVINGVFQCPPNWYANEEDACPNVDLIGTNLLNAINGSTGSSVVKYGTNVTSSEDEDDDGIDGDGIEFDDTILVPDAGIDNEDDDDVDDIDRLDPDKEGDTKITCYQCTEDQQVIADTFWNFCDQDEGWYDTPEEACGKGRRCYGCGINKGLTAFDQFTSEIFPKNQLDGEDCPNVVSDDFDGWYNTPEETQCDPDALVYEIVEPPEYTCVWCPATDDSIGYYYIQSPEEGGTYGWNESDGEPPVPVPMRPNGNGVLQDGWGLLGNWQPAHCSNFDTPNFASPESELQQFCYDLGYNPIIPEDEIVNESDWTEDDIMDEDGVYSGPINCLYCPGVSQFFPSNAYQGGFQPSDIVGGTMSEMLGLPGGNQGWWNNSGDPSGPQSSTLYNPSAFLTIIPS